jgi:hypothetical protein
MNPGSNHNVTVSDILYGLYDALHVRMNEEEVHASTDTGSRDDVNNAFKKRCDKVMEHNVGLAEKERKNGHRRLDMLRGNTVFYGLFIDPNTKVVRFSVKKN